MGRWGNALHGWWLHLCQGMNVMGWVEQAGSSGTCVLVGIVGKDATILTAATQL
jgi:hypothetical protein